MQEQARVSARRLRARRGLATTVLLEHKEADGWHGRTPWQAPEVDGDTRLENAGTRARTGDFVPAVITGTRAYDVRARRTEA
jgi:ribosomal protein S12 methylthiotransferase